MINSYNKTRQIILNDDENIARKQVLSYAYQLWQHDEFKNEYLTIIPGYMIEKGEHHIYTNIKEKDFIMYTMFIDSKIIKLSGKNVDAEINIVDKLLTLVYYEKDKSSYVDKILEGIDSFHEVDFAKLDVATYFYIPNDKSPEFYKKLFDYVCALDCVDVYNNGIMVTNRKGGFAQFNSNDTGLITPNKFFYSNGTIFIGFHKKNDMLVLCNIPKDTFKKVKEDIKTF